MPSRGPSVARRSWLGTGKADSVAIKRQVEPEARPRCLFPPAFHKVDSVCGAIQTRRESERTSFVCRGRRTVEQRKKQAELSALSCFLGLALSFLRGGSGRFVLVPSCTSAPLSGGLRRPRRNAALGPQGTWLRAPPDNGLRLPTRVLLPLLGIALSASHFLACGGGVSLPKGASCFL